MTSGQRIVYDSEKFDELVEPWRVNLLEIIKAGSALRSEHELTPAPGSEAERELAEQGAYAHDWGRVGVQSAISWSGTLLFAAEDHALSITRLIIGEPSSFGPLALARASLEAAGRSLWFTEPGIGARVRTARWRTEQLYDIYERKRIGQLQPDEAALRSKTITDSAEALGFEVLGGKSRSHRMIEEDRPSGNQTFKRLLLDLEGDGKKGLGHAVHALLSAVAHGTGYGLLVAASEVERIDDTTSMATFSMSVSTTNMVVAIVTVGYVRAILQHRAFMGWDDPGFEKACANAMRMAFRAF